MSETQDREFVPVLIIGAGPAGLTTAIALARHGVPSLIVERRLELSSLPRATGITTRSMEILRGWDLEDEVRAGGVEVEWQGWSCESLATASEGWEIPTGVPTAEQSVLVSPTSPACVPQDHLEPVLLRHVRSFPVARAELGTELVAVENGPDGVRAVLRDIANGGLRGVGARYIVAADGAHSTVRQALDITMHGPDGLGEAASAVFRAPLWHLLGERRYGFYDINHAHAGGIILPAGPDDRWLYGLVRPPGHEDLDDVSPETMTRRIRLATGVPDLQPHIERIGTFTFAAQLAERFRRNSAFLVGDAAHRVTPRGGTGMNTAIHDGYDLGWKLGWVLRGWAEPELLDSYEAERRPVAEHNAALSAQPPGTEYRAGQELPADIGGRIPHFWLPTPGGRASTLDLLHDGLTLFTGPERTAWDSAAHGVAGSPPIALRSLDAITARAMGIRRSGALLVRPDGTPCGWWTDATGGAAALRAAVDAARAGTPAASAALGERDVA